MVTRSATSIADTQLKKNLLFFFQNRQPRAWHSTGYISYVINRVKELDLVEALEDFVTDEFAEKYTNRHG